MPSPTECCLVTVRFAQYKALFIKLNLKNQHKSYRFNSKHAKVRTGVFNEIPRAETPLTQPPPCKHNIHSYSLLTGESRPCRAVAPPAAGTPPRQAQPCIPLQQLRVERRGPSGGLAGGARPAPAPPRSLRRSRNDIAGTRGRRGSEGTRYGGAAGPNAAGSEVCGGPGHRMAESDTEWRNRRIKWGGRAL